MKVLEKVLWAVDFNQNHEVSTKKFESIYEQFGNEIVILNVLPENLLESNFQEIVERSVISELSMLKENLKSLDKSKIKTIFRYGSIVDTIIDVAEKENVNAIFIDQGNGYDGKFNKLGVHTFNTILNAHKPVVVISREEKKQDYGVLSVVDFSKPSEKALKNAILHAKKTNQKLTVMSVYSPQDVISPRLRRIGIDSEVENKALYGKYMKDFDEFLRKFSFVDLDFSKEVLIGDVSSEIVKRAQKANVLYIGSTGRTGLKRVLMGSVTEEVVQEVPCDMVITKSEDIFKLRFPEIINDVDNHFQLASQLAEYGYYDKAIENYKECLNLNTAHIPSVKALSDLYSKMGDSEQVAYYEEMYKTIIEQFNNWKIEEEVRKSST